MQLKEYLPDWGSNRVRDVVLTVVVALIFAYAWPFGLFNSPNERARIYTTHAMVDHGQISVEHERARWGDTYDLSEFEGNWYSNKPPGSSVVGAVVYAPLRLIAPNHEWSYEGLLLLFRMAVMVPLSVLGFWLFRKLGRRLGISETSIDISSLAWVLGSAAFCYTTAFFSHHIIAVALIVAIWLLIRARDRVAGRNGTGHEAGGSAVWPMFGAGVALGLAGMTEYQAGISCILISVYLLTIPELRSFKVLGAFAAGAVPFVVGLLIYQNAAFGGPFELTYFYHRGGGGPTITLPRLDRFVGLLFSPHRGVLTTSPWVLFAIPGAMAMWKGKFRGLAVLLAALVLWRIGFLSSYKWWNGDWGFGPRHIVPVLGAASLLAGAGFDWVRGNVVGEALARGTAVAGVAYNQIQNAFLGILPLYVRNPIGDVVAPMFRNDIPSPNWVQYLFGVVGVTSLIPLAILVIGICGYLLVAGGGIFGRAASRLVVAVGALVPVVLLFAFVTTGERADDWPEDKYNRLLVQIGVWHNYEIGWQTGSFEPRKPKSRRELEPDR